MKYNVFDRTSYDKMNEKPLSYAEAKTLSNRLSFDGGYDFFTSPYIIQGIYPATERGFNKFLDEMGWDRCGQSYDSFIYAMKYDELYCN